MFESMVALAQMLLLALKTDFLRFSSSCCGIDTKINGKIVVVTLCIMWGTLESNQLLIKVLTQIRDTRPRIRYCKVKDPLPDPPTHTHKALKKSFKCSKLTIRSVKY